jgi:Flp pilus assembly protein TadB
MTTWIIALGGALIGIAVALAVLVMLQPKPRLSAALDRMGEPTTPALSRPEQGASLMEVRTATWVRRWLSWIPGGTTEQDRILAQANETSILAQKALYALAGLLIPSLFGLFTQMLDIMPAMIPAALGLVFAALLWLIPDLQVKEKAAALRKEFSQSIPTYLDLIAVEREGGRPPAVALFEAAAVPTSTPFTMIIDALNLARLKDERPWDALHSLGQQLDVPELVQAADIVSMAGTEGAAISHSLRQAARSMRQGQETEDHKRANKNSNQVQLMVLFQAFLFVAIILTPLLMGLK